MTLKKNIASLITEYCNVKITKEGDVVTHFPLLSYKNVKMCNFMAILFCLYL